MRAGSAKGQSLVESALVLTVFTGLVLGIASVGQMLFTRQALAQRVHDAARWGAMHPYDAPAIRNIVLYGAARPVDGAPSFLGLSSAAVEVNNPGGPGADCRISVAVSGHGVRSVEPCEPGAGDAPGPNAALSKP